MSISFWKNASSRRRRIITILFFFLVSVVATGIGTLANISKEDAKQINDELDQLRANVSVEWIFGHNLMLALIMFIPIAGPILGLWILYNTGVAIAAQAITIGVSPILALLVTLIVPVAWLEFTAYSTAFAESFWLIRRAEHGMGRREIKNAAILIAIVTVILLVAAIIETALILQLGG